MGRETVYRKTASGSEAIAKRSPALGPRERSLLIMIDGRRGSGELAALGDLDAMLPALLAHGFIEPVPEQPKEAKGPDSKAPDSVAPSDGDGTLSVSAAQRLAVRRLNDLLGPAAVDMCMRLEKARTAQEYLAALRQVEGSLRQAIGAEAASRFAQEVGAVRTG
jgi:hypothetical protein